MVKLVVSLEKNNECDCWRKAVPFEPHEALSSRSCDLSFQFTVAVHKFEFFGGWAGLLWTRSTGLLRLPRLIDLQVAWAPGAGVPLPPWRNVPPHHLGLPVLVNPRVTEA